MMELSPETATAAIPSDFQLEVRPRGTTMDSFVVKAADWAVRHSVLINSQPRLAETPGSPDELSLALVELVEQLTDELV
jgi:hypothetical protein